MKRLLILIAIIMLIPLFLMACTADTGHEQSELGLVTGSKSDEQAISEVVTAYLEAINNYTWEEYDKTKGLEFWTEEGKNDLLNDSKKLPNLEKSIKENKISRQFEKSQISKITVDADAAIVEAVTIADSTSTHPAFNGRAQSEEKLVMTKANNRWYIAERSAQVGIIQSE